MWTKIYTLFYEYYVSAQEEKEGKDPRFFEEEKDEGREEYGAEKKTERPQTINSMIPQAARLRKAKDFKEVFGKGRGVRDGRLFLKAHVTKNKETRFGIVVSKQVASYAVGRNRIKRLLREALRSCAPSIRAGHDIVLVTLPGFAAASLQEAQQKVMSIIKKASLLKP